MSAANSFTHLTLEERRSILAGIKNSSTKTAIAQTLGKDKSTLVKEIKLHRALTYKCKMLLECNNYRKCIFVCAVKLFCRHMVTEQCKKRLPGDADIFLDHLPINVCDESSCYDPKTSSVLKWAHSSK